MNLQDFDFYSKDEQLQFLSQYGTYLTTRNGRVGPIRLYALGTFYVEVWFAPEYQDVKIVRGFNCATFLDPYLNKIEVVDLIAPIK